MDNEIKKYCEHCKFYSVIGCQSTLICREGDRFRAADVQPVKHGRWICPVSVGNGIKFCSVCHNEAYWDTDYGQQLFDYCPYCGARIDGGTE